MAILETFTKQPGETLDYDISFAEFLAGYADTGLSATVTAAAGITLDFFSLTQGVVKVWLSGGTTGQSYKVTVRLTTTGGRIKEDEIVIKIKET